MKILYDRDGLEILDDFVYSYKLDSYRRKNLYYKLLISKDGIYHLTTFSNIIH